MLVPESSRATPLAAAKGEAPGRYYAGLPILARGARVGILCDTLHGDREIELDYQAGLRTAAELIEMLGFEPVIDPLHSAVAPYFERWAGTVSQRAQHFIDLIERHGVDAIFPLFGKGGCHAVVDAIAASGYRPKRPIVLIGGFSQHSDWSLFGQSPHGRGFFSHQLSVTQCAYWKLLPRANVDNLQAVLREAGRLEYSGIECLNPARVPSDNLVEGVLAGGNLTAVLANATKPWMPSFENKIVYCEDFDRHAHDFHRGFSAFARIVERAGAAAILVGAMLPMKRVAHAKLDPEARKLRVEEDRAELACILQEVAQRTSVPVFHHPEIGGHGAMNYPLAFGASSCIVRDRDGSFLLSNELEVAQ